MRRVRYHTKNPPRLQGFDTEARRGDLLVVCSPTGSHEYRATKDGPRRLLDWLWREARDTNFFYNLTYDRDVLLKPFAHRMKRNSRSVRCGPYSIRLLGNKSIKLRKGGSHRVKEFYDISGFFSDGERTRSLQEASELFLGDSKRDDIDRARLGEEVGYYESRQKEVIEYCKQDAALALGLAKLLIRTLSETLGFYPSRFNSKASISKAWLKSTIRNYSCGRSRPCGRLAKPAIGAGRLSQRYSAGSRTSTRSISRRRTETRFESCPDSTY